MSGLPRVLVCDRIEAAGVDILRRVAEVVETDSPGEDDLAAALEGCAGLVVRSATKVTARVLEQAADLRIVARAGAGVDNIDVDAATRRGVLVVNSPGGNTLAAAEHTIAMLLAAARNIPQANASMKAGEFDRKRFMGRQAAGKTLGLVGLGKIGSEVARRARALGMEVLAFDPYAPEGHAEKLGARLVSLDDLLVAADFLSVHVPLTEQTRGLIGAAELARARPGVVVINCARGGIVDEDALLAALREGRVAAAALDVFACEPQFNRALVAHPAVIATPHLGASTAEAQEMVAVDVAEQIVDFLGGRPPRSPVNVVALAPEVMARLEPFLVLATRLGTLAGVLTPGAPREVAVAASSLAPPEGLGLIAGRIVCGVLAGRVDQSLNDVNALLVARERGMQVSHALTGEDHGYSRHIEAQVRHAEGSCVLAGAAIEAGRPRILRIGGFSVDMVPEGEWVLVWKRNPRAPGFIGAVGSTLGQAGVGILSIQVGQEEIEGMGLLAARVDRRLPGPVRRAVADLPEFERLELVTFEERQANGRREAG